MADWYEGGTLNTCHLALDLHVEQGRGDQVALIYDSPASGEILQWTFSELLAEVARLAGLLTSNGVSLGDRGDYLFADGARGRVCHVGLRQNRGNPFSRFRWVCGKRVGNPN